MNEEQEYRSNAQWPKGTCGGHRGDCSSDIHWSKGCAEGVCALLEREGFGGEGKVFPIKTWVDEVD